ncbi:MAG: 2-succinyl-5-enolpyruvyl-6-hydroxy-3-cyclohexene-1-carboxylic-acid synthase [Opitutales bacterium]
MNKSVSDGMENADSIKYSNINTYWGDLLIQRLRANGIRRFVISPGSRNTPLTFACSHLEGIEVEVIVDERSAAFFALGWSKSTGRQPVALICTSGSALSHYLPAIIEARYGHIPLLVLSADRPDELQDCHAGQTIRQSGIFGVYVENEIAAPAPSLGTLNDFASRVDSLCCALKRPGSYAAHINLPFRDPLTPGVEDGKRESYIRHFRELTESESLRTLDIENGNKAGGTNPESNRVVDPASAARRDDSAYPEDASLPHGASLAGENDSVTQAPFKVASKSILIVGPYCLDLGYENALEHFIQKFSEAFKGPVLCDGLSRHRFQVENTIAHYDLYLRDGDIRNTLKPDSIILIGDLPTSKPLRAAIEAWESPITVLSFDSDRRDAGIPGKWTSVQLRDQGEIEALTESIGSEHADDQYISVWAEKDAFAAKAISDFRADEAPVEWLLPREITRSIRAPTNIWISSSMPVRDWEAFACRCECDLRVFVNRGANGIDGIIAAASGMARGGQRQSLLVIGDVALSHDAGSLALLAKLQTPLTILVIQNGGGRIFEHLPISQVDFDFERFYLTPSSVNLQKLAESYGLDFHAIEQVAHLRKALSEQPSKHRILAIKTDAEDNLARRKLFISTLLSKL